MIVTFRGYEQQDGGPNFPSFIEGLIAEHSLKKICEIGAGANPVLSTEFVRNHGLRYTAVDESESEASKSSMEDMSVLDICAPGAKIPGAPYDMIFGQAVAEHFYDSDNAYKNMFAALAPNGICVHSFSTLYAFPFLMNRMLPDWISGFLLKHFRPRDEEKHGKFKAYYRRCRGPSKSQIEFFRSLGFEVLEYRAYFGHEYYKKRLPLFDFLEERKAELLSNSPIAYLTSYATVILKRPHI